MVSVQNRFSAALHMARLSRWTRLHAQRWGSACGSATSSCRWVFEPRYFYVSVTDDCSWTLLGVLTVCKVFLVWNAPLHGLVVHFGWTRLASHYWCLLLLLFSWCHMQSAPAEANRVQKKKLWEAVQPDLKTGEDGTASLDDLFVHSCIK
jgi:hypothetical protein